MKLFLIKNLRAFFKSSFMKWIKKHDPTYKLGYYFEYPIPIKQPLMSMTITENGIELDTRWYLSLWLEGRFNFWASEVMQERKRLNL